MFCEKPLIGLEKLFDLEPKAWPTIPCAEGKYPVSKEAILQIVTPLVTGLSLEIAPLLLAVCKNPFLDASKYSIRLG